MIARAAPRAELESGDDVGEEPPTGEVVSQLPLVVWAFVAAVAAVLLALLGATAYAVLRRRPRIARLPARQVVGLFVLVAVPWLVVLLAPITIRVSIHGVGPLLGWLALALLCFMVLVAAPLAVALVALTWISARRRTVSGATAPGSGAMHS